MQSTTSLRSTKTQPQQTLPTSPRACRRRESSTPGDAMKALPQLARDDGAPSAHESALPVRSEPQATPPSPPREPGEMTPRTPLPIPTPVSGVSPLGSGSGPRPPPLYHLTLPAPPPAPAGASPHPSSSSSGNGDQSRLRDRDVNRLMRELWDTRRQLTAMQAREQAILDDLERLGARPNSAGANRNGVSQDGAYASPLLLLSCVFSLFLT